MTCIAVHVITGRRCDRRAVQGEFCSQHRRSTWLRFLAACGKRDRLTRSDGTPDDGRVQVLCDALRRSCRAFGPDATHDVIDLVATIPNVGSLDAYIAAVLAVVLPRLQAHIDAINADAHRLNAETSARHLSTDALIAQQARWNALLASMDTTLCH